MPEQASARRTTSRVHALGALAKAFIAELGMSVLSHVIAVGPEKLERRRGLDELVARRPARLKFF